jgi:hypothetical protein
LKRLVVIICCAFFIVSCKDKKKRDVAPEEEQPPVVIAVNTGPECKALPPTPVPFGWVDSTADVHKNVNAFFFNPVNPNEVIYVVNGNITGYNKMCCYNIPLKLTTDLAYIGPYIPKINKKGWIVFSSADNNIYTIKTTGEGMRQLTSGNVFFDPQWDYTDTNIYFFRKSFSANPSLIMNMTASGIANNGFDADISNAACFRKKNKIVYLKSVNTLINVVLRDTNNAETVLYTTSYVPGSGKTPFEDMSMDLDDRYLFWSNTTGIFKFNMSTFKIDTVLKNCPNFIYDNPIVSFQNNNEITVSRHMMTPIQNTFLYHEYKAVEMNLLTKQLNEIKIFP